MKIAIPVADGMLCAHFGHCQVFAILHINDETKAIEKVEALTPPPHEPGVIPKWLNEVGADMIIAGGMGMKAQQFFTQFGIKVVVGAQPGKPEDIAQAWLDGKLTTGANMCDH
ncbi:MAG: NifB/NifX family molybdenum-iron cluster-binding protein [Desulfovibrio sp.]|uniref:NifB/NifX family molybdenum-iron cluster-binding protein n=1 Tax=Desulfovibrio sp. 7SRBS1 TaxID=3378064 RepID=UPI003B3EBE7D